MSEVFQYLNNYYDRIFVLSLPRLEKRIEHINRALKGLDFDFFWGIDKNETSLELLKEQSLYSTTQYHKFYKKPEDMTLGMICCSLGHLNIYEHIVENNFQRTLILEDDVIPDIKNLEQFPAIIKELPDDWDLFYLGYEKNEQHGKIEKIKKKIYQLINNHAQLKLTREMYEYFYPVPLTAHIAKAGFHDCTHAYSITLQGAQKLARNNRPVSFMADNLLSFMVSTGKIRGYISKPKLFHQLSAFGDKLHSLTASKNQ